MARRSEMCAAFGFNAQEQRKPFAFANGMAIIPVAGTLINRFNWAYSSVTGYNFIRSQLNAALADDDVTGIVLDVNSYGGEAAGCFELAADIRAARDVKPVMAVVDSNAYSAGYAIASAASKIVLTPSGGVGSIGVIAMHVDMSKALADYGYKVTLIYEAEHKADGNPYEPLPDDVKASIQSSIHTAYGMFTKLVAENLGMDEQKVRDTKSRIYRAEDALSLGLIHAIATPNQAVQAFFDELSGSNLQLRNQGVSMTTATQEPGADQQAANQAAVATAASEARIAERARVAGITGCEEAKGRTALANHLAMNTDMSVDAAKGVLAVAPVEQTQASTSNAFKQTMDASQHPNVGSEGGEGDKAEGGQDSGANLVSRILGAQAQATGVSSAKSK
jgi:signal peptide peptidase SppA